MSNKTNSMTVCFTLDAEAAKCLDIAVIKKLESKVNERVFYNELITAGADDASINSVKALEEKRCFRVAVSPERYILLPFMNDRETCDFNEGKVYSHELLEFEALERFTAEMLAIYNQPKVVRPKRRPDAAKKNRTLNKKEQAEAHYNMMVRFLTGIGWWSTLSDEQKEFLSAHVIPKMALAQGRDKYTWEVWLHKWLRQNRPKTAERVMKAMEASANKAGHATMWRYNKLVVTFKH